MKNSKPTAPSNGNDIAARTARLWQAAVNLWGSIEPADYKRYVLPIIFFPLAPLREAPRPHEIEMKPLPPPPVRGDTPWERFDNAVGKLLSVPKGVFLKEQARLKRQREKKRAAKKKAH